MSRAITTSIRLDKELRDELELAASITHQGKNRIIVDALRDYLKKINKNKLIKEAQRQSILASQQSSKEEEDWIDAIDDQDWKV